MTVGGRALAPALYWMPFHLTRGCNLATQAVGFRKIIQGDDPRSSPFFLLLRGPVVVVVDGPVLTRHSIVRPKERNREGGRGRERVTPIQRLPSPTHARPGNRHIVLSLPLTFLQHEATHSRTSRALLQKQRKRQDRLIYYPGNNGLIWRDATRDDRPTNHTARGIVRCMCVCTGTTRQWTRFPVCTLTRARVYTPARMRARLCHLVAG